MASMNPILSELDALSPGAKAALQQAHGAATSQAAMQPPQIQRQPAPGPEPSPIQMQAPSQMPQVPEMGQQPKISLAPQPQGTLAGDKQALAEQAAKKPALETVYSKIAGSKFGQAHPFAGKALGALAQIPATAADFAATGIAPRLGALIPGTTANRGVELRDIGARLGQEEKNQQAEATSGAENARAGLEEAQTAALPAEESSKQALTDAQITNLLHPQAKTEFEAWRQKNPDADPLQFLRGQAQIEQQYRAPKSLEPRSVLSPSGGGPIQANYHPDTGVTTDASGNVIPNPVPYEKPNVALIDRGQNEADKVATRLTKPYDTALTKSQDQLDRVDETSRMLASPGAEGKALGVPKLLTALVSGQGTGVRITQPELNAIYSARGIKGDVDAFFNQISGQGRLSAQQIKEVNGILNDVKARLQDKIAIHSATLDAMNGADSREEVVAADKKAKQLLRDYESYSHTATLKDGTRVGSKTGDANGKWFNILTGEEEK